jgi:hypothetical protein
MLTPLQRIQHLLSGVETGQVLLADTTMEPVFSPSPQGHPRVLAALQAGRPRRGGAARGGWERRRGPSQRPASPRSGLGDRPSKAGPRRPDAPSGRPLDPMFTFDVTLVAAITVSAPDEQDAREKITGALCDQPRYPGELARRRADSVHGAHG